jgi:hypothetical protein
MTQGTPAEKRQHRRIVAQIPVRFGLEGRMCEGMIIDISEGGVQIRSSDSFAAGMVVDVFVQFPRRRLRLRVRVAWVRGEPPAMGLTYIQPDRSLIAAYDQWVEEMRATPGSWPGNADRAGAPDAGPGPPTPTASSGSPSPAVPEPEGPVERHVETARGNQYDLRIERTDTGWRLLIYPSPRSFPTPRPEVDLSFADYAAADAALREFLKAH